MIHSEAKVQRSKLFTPSEAIARLPSSLGRKLLTITPNFLLISERSHENPVTLVHGRRTSYCAEDSLDLGIKDLDDHAEHYFNFAVSTRMIHKMISHSLKYKLLIRPRSEVEYHSNNI